MATSWNYIWGESWHEYIQRSTLSDDLAAAQRDSSRAMIGAISEQTQAILAGMESSTSTLSRQMESMAAEVAGLDATLQWGFGQTIAQMGAMNATLQQLLRIAKTPVQTWAYNQFEIARENFRKGLYTNCVKRLEKAMNGDQTSPGYEEEWRFHQMMGVVRLGFIGCEPQLINVPHAEEAFVLAARYARADEPREAAKALLSAGRSAFVQGKLPEALSYTEQAISLDASLSEAFFQLAKFHMAAGEPGRALPALRTAMDQAPGYVVQAAADGDFQRHAAELNVFLERARDEVQATLTPRVAQALDETVEWAKTFGEVLDSEVLDRWRELPRGSWGLLALLTYQRGGFDRDRGSVAYTRKHTTERIAAEKALAIREVAALEGEIASERKALASVWKPVYLWGSVLGGLLVMGLIFQSLANAKGSGFRHGLGVVVGSLGVIALALGWWLPVLVFLVAVVAALVKYRRRRARIAALEADLKNRNGAGTA